MSYAISKASRMLKAATFSLCVLTSNSMADEIWLSDSLQVVPGELISIGSGGIIFDVECGKQRYKFPFSNVTQVSINNKCSEYWKFVIMGDPPECMIENKSNHVITTSIWLKNDEVMTLIDGGVVYTDGQFFVTTYNSRIKYVIDRSDVNVYYPEIDTCINTSGYID